MAVTHDHDEEGLLWQVMVTVVGTRTQPTFPEVFLLVHALLRGPT